jgi:APA family basic amino acid/polyamine antiporter
MTALLYASGSAERILESWARPSPGISWSAVGLALVAVLWAFDGWHFVSFAAGEVRDPGRTIPRSVLVGTAITGAIYLLVNVAYYAALPADAIRGTDRVAAAAVEHAFGPARHSRCRC